jgi:hypothetical protein
LPNVRDVLPNPVYDAVAQHLRTYGNRAHRDWDMGEAHEDVLTGAAFAGLTTHRSRRVFVRDVEWRWRITSRKFGSGGKGSEESLTGADGIIEIQVTHLATGIVEQKSLLVQAKKEWTGRDARLLSQVSDIEELAPRSSAAIDYSAAGYRAIDGAAVMHADGNRREVPSEQDLPLGDYLSERFLGCEAGLRGLYYEPRRRLLHLPASPGRPEAVVIIVRDRLRVEIEEIPA